MLIRHTQIITDPFPRHSEYNWKKDSQYLFDKFFGIKNKIEAPEDISIWAAYRMGYDNAYAEIEARLPDAEFTAESSEK